VQWYRAIARRLRRGYLYFYAAAEAMLARLPHYDDTAELPAQI
jgi:hypothetical protein